jgi:hypothetical protein
MPNKTRHKKIYLQVHTALQPRRPTSITMLYRKDSEIEAEFVKDRFPDKSVDI